MQLRLQGLEAGLQGIAHSRDIKHLINVIIIGRLQLLPEASGEAVHHRHEEEAVELQLHCLHHVIPDACNGPAAIKYLFPHDVILMPSTFLHLPLL